MDGKAFDVIGLLMLLMMKALCFVFASPSCCLHFAVTSIYDDDRDDTVHTICMPMLRFASARVAAAAVLSPLGTRHSGTGSQSKAPSASKIALCGMTVRAVAVPKIPRK